jgi:hypothetical protein
MHVSLNFGPRLTAEMDSGTATCLMAMGSASPRWELWCYHVSHGLQRGVDHRNKVLAALGTQLGPRVSKVRSHVTEVLARRANRRCHHKIAICVDRSLHLAC